MPTTAGLENYKMCIRYIGEALPELKGHCLELLDYAHGHPKANVWVKRPGDEKPWAVRRALLTGVVVPPPMPANPCGAVPKGNTTKPNPSLLYQDVAGALAEVAKTLDQGAKKYPRGNWAKLPDAQQQYFESFWRHTQRMTLGGFGSVNHEDGAQLDLDHAIMNLLFIRQLMLNAEAA